MEKELVLRYAPTPSGFLHAGNLFNFTLNFLIAKALNARILLRIDDLDAARKRPEYVQHIFDCLNNFGLSYDFGPSDLFDFEQNWTQELRKTLYQSAFDTLKEMGLLFPSNLSRTELIAKYNGIYPKELVGNEPKKFDSAWRLNFKIKQSQLPDFLDRTFELKHEDLEQSQFPIIRKKDGQFAYQLTSVVDDVRFGVTHIIRGEDLYPSSLIQGFIKKQLFPEMPNWEFHHHQLIKSGGIKLSKSNKLGIRINSKEKADFNHIITLCRNLFSSNEYNSPIMLSKMLLIINDLEKNNQLDKSGKFFRH
jgi:glutamyl-tRNA synthetase